MPKDPRIHNPQPKKRIADPRLPTSKMTKAQERILAKKKPRFEIKGRLRADATKILQGVPVNVKHKHSDGTVHKHPIYFNERGGVKRHPINNNHPEDRNYSAWEIAVGEL